MRGMLRFTLDLFAPAPTPAPTVPARPRAKPQAIPTDARPAETLAPAVFRHPRANREARLGNAIVAYEFKRGKRRTIGFAVGPDGLVVSAPKWVSVADVHTALLEKSAWIVRKLGETRERHERLVSSRIAWKDGAVIPFLGEPMRVVLDPSRMFGHAGAVLQDNGEAPADETRLNLRLGLPHLASADQIRDSVQAWLMRQARRVFIERLDHFAPSLQVQWRKLSLSSAGTRWGSARSDGSIRLNWRLIHFRANVIDYVVVHELSHLRVMDHSPRFWDTVRAVVPDYAELRTQLKDESVPQWS
jgi:predicted metal-dependent hydrolase